MGKTATGWTCSSRYCIDGCKWSVVSQSLFSRTATDSFRLRSCPVREPPGKAIFVRYIYDQSNHFGRSQLRRTLLTRSTLLVFNADHRMLLMDAFLLFLCDRSNTGIKLASTSGRRSTALPSSLSQLSIALSSKELRTLDRRIMLKLLSACSASSPVSGHLRKDTSLPTSIRTMEGVAWIPTRTLISDLLSAITIRPFSCSC